MNIRNLFFFGMMIFTAQAFADAPPAPAKSETVPPKPEVKSADVYTFPGFVYERDGEWMGSDYLYNLQKDIGFVLEIIIPENEKIELNKQKLTDLATNALKQNKLEPRTNIAPGISALPFFYLQIMIFPTEEGNVSLCTGSLLESVTLARINTQKDSAIQAITWEKKTMFMSTPETFEQDINKTVEEIAKTFGERWSLFEKMKDQKTPSRSTLKQKVSKIISK